MHRLGLRVVEFAVPDTGPGRHDLHVTRSDHRTGTNAVLVLERAFENVGDDLHVPVPMRLEAGAGPDPVLVDDPQRTKAHVLWIVVMTEGEGMPAVQPAEVFGSALGSRSYSDHGRLQGISLSAPEYRMRFLGDNLLTHRGCVYDLRTIAIRRPRLYQPWTS